MRTSKQIITVRGNLGADPKKIELPSGDWIVEFRLASTERKFNKSTEQWEDGNTSWYTVIAYRTLAANLYRSLAKGDPVVVTGRLNIRQWTAKDGERTGTAVEILADAVGHDLSLGFTEFRRNTDAGFAPASHDAAPAEPSTTGVTDWGANIGAGGSEHSEAA